MGAGLMLVRARMLGRMEDTRPPIVLDPQHKKFADKYLECGRISESARHAGYAVNSAHVSGNRLLKRPDIQLYLREQGNKVTQQSEDLAAQVINEFKNVAFVDIGELISIDSDGQPHIDFSAASPEVIRAIASIKTKQRQTKDRDGNVTTERETAFALNDKLRALDGLAKHLGLYKADEQRVVLDVADRLLAARQRLRSIED